MAASDEQQGANTPEGTEPVSAPEESSAEESKVVTHTQTTDDSYGYYDDPYAYGDGGAELSPPPSAAPPAPAPPPPPSTPPPSDSDDDEDDGMLRMSFLDHLEELRSRIIHALLGVGIAFAASLFFSDKLWDFVITPVLAALRNIGAKEELIMITPMESFNILWVKLPILSAVFLSSPWILYQVWAFIAPGLYPRERKWAAPFVICSAGLFIAGGAFAYFVAFRYGLSFLLGLGINRGIAPMITVSEYFDLFINVMLGVGLVFELPVLIFFLTLLRIVTPKFLVANSRYAILIIVVIAAIVTPTPDIFNLMLFATPMCLLFYVGIFASYLLVLSREGRRFPWAKVLYVLAVIAFVIAGMLYLAVTKYGLHFTWNWPFLVR